MWMSTYSGDSSGFTLGLMSSKNLMEAMVLSECWAAQFCGQRWLL